MKKIYCIGGGTRFYVRPHFALSAPASGKTARALHSIISGSPYFSGLDKELILTRMADPSSSLDTNEDVEKLVQKLVGDPLTKIVFFSVAMCDFTGHVRSHGDGETTPSGKDKPRLQSTYSYEMALSPAKKIIGDIRSHRKDIFLVGFKTTSGATENQQFDAALRLCKGSHCNLVLANDTHTRVNMIVTPEQSRYAVSTDRSFVLSTLVDMAGSRSRGTFARTISVPGALINIDSEAIPYSLRTVVKYCVNEGAYQEFNGVTVGHFAFKQPDGSILCSIRRSNYNKKLDLVKIVSENEHLVTAYGAKPSAGSRSQWIMFDKHPTLDCVVHFHCPLKKKSKVPVRKQKYFECGSHECGHNTADGLVPVSEDGKIKAVFLENHGPNIVFSHDVDPQRVIDFIVENFDVKKTTREVSP